MKVKSMQKGEYYKISAALSCVVGCVIAAPTGAATPACANISNVARLAFTEGDTPHIIESNVAAFRAAQLLDLHLTADSATVPLARNAAGAIPFALTNSGNGEEAFVLDARIDGGDASVTGFAIDSDGNGRFDAAIDVLIPNRAVTAPLAPGVRAALLVLVDGGASASPGTLTVTARAVTGYGTPGMGFAGGNGCEAVVGATGANAAATVKLTAAPGSDLSQVTLVKSQSVVAPDGSAMPVKGATVIYTIESRFGGSGVVRAARFADLIPQGARYIPGSLSLDGAALTDAEDRDAGGFDGEAVRVALGDVSAPAVHTIQFRVKIQ